MNRRKKDLLISTIGLTGLFLFGIFFTGLAISDMSRTLAPPYEIGIGVACVIGSSFGFLAVWKKYRKNR